MSSSRIFYGGGRVQCVDVISTYGKEPAYSLKLSPDGKLIAVGNDEGFLEIYSLQDGPAWDNVAVYDAGASIRAIVWHPTKPNVLFCGSTNGCVHRITIVLRGINSICDGTVPGYIHLLQMSQDGRKLAIGHGRSVSIVNDPFVVPNELGTLIPLNIPSSDTVRSFSEYQLARGIFFVSSRIILVAFLGREGITAYSAIDHCPLWTIQLRDSTFIGSAAISPSGERLAVMNLSDGIDFYSTTHRRLLSTTHYILSERVPPRNLLVDIVFIDEDTVAFGHSDGYVALATFGINEILARGFEADRDTYNAPIQTIAFGFINRQPCILSIVPRADPWTRSHDHNRLTLKIHIGIIDHDEERGLVPDVTALVLPPTNTPDNTTLSGVDYMLHLTPSQVVFFVLFTICGTLYIQYQLMWTPQVGSVTITTALSSPTAVPQVSELPSQSIVDSSPNAHTQPFYAFTLTGTVAGTASIALPTKETDSM